MNNILGSVIKEIRKDKKITQSELARLTGLNKILFQITKMANVH